MRRAPRSTARTPRRARRPRAGSSHICATRLDKSFNILNPGAPAAVDTPARLRYVARIGGEATSRQAPCAPPGAGNGTLPATVEELLGRPVVEVGDGAFCDYLDGAGVLVTGAGGSVGSELCARLAGLGVRELVLVDQAEGPLVALAGSLHGTRTIPVLADIKSPVRTAEIFERHRPDVVFHAAAYKQVPLLESFPVEGAAVNVLGTKAVADAARHAGVERLVLFSTDKAVHATSVLGLTKSVAEWIVAAAGERAPAGRFACVRLGNVVDSAGSILPLFRSQIARGAPVTVTHPE